MFKPYKEYAFCFYNKFQLGLGDLLREMFRRDGWFGTLKDFSKKHKAKILLCCHNSNAVQLFQYSSYLEALNCRWERRPPNYKRISSDNNWTYGTMQHKSYLRKHFEWQRPDIELEPSEEELYKEITANKYIFLHPFAGDPSRMPYEPKYYRQLVNRLINTYGRKIVVVGDSYIRRARLRKINETKIVESFDHSRGLLVNLVNKGSLRLAVKLLLNASCFIGTWSAFLCQAWECKIPSIVLASNGHAKIIQSKHFARRWHKDCHAVATSNKTPQQAFNEVATLYKQYHKLK